MYWSPFSLTACSSMFFHFPNLSRCGKTGLGNRCKGPENFEFRYSHNKFTYMEIFISDE